MDKPTLTILQVNPKVRKKFIYGIGALIEDEEQMNQLRDENEDKIYFWYEIKEDKPSMGWVGHENLPAFVEESAELYHVVHRGGIVNYIHLQKFIEHFKNLLV